MAHRTEGLLGSDAPFLFCGHCYDTGTVCEDHPDRPWGPIVGDAPYIRACFCGGAGQPCGYCCDPPPMGGLETIANAFTPRRHLRVVK